MILREKEAVIEGYPVFVHYQKVKHHKHYLETVQIFGRNSPFLPFNLVCKIAKKFLGEDYLSLVEIFKNDRKIYVWSVCSDKKGNPIESPYKVEVEDCVFENLEYNYMQPNQVNFF